MEELATALQEEIETKKQEINDLETLVERISNEVDTVKEEKNLIAKEKEDLV